MSRRLPIRSGFPAAILLLLFSAGAHAQECLDCHSTALDDKRPELTISPDAFQQGIHQTLGCQGCHTDVRGYPHNNVVLPKCETCHADQKKAFDTSVHGRAVARGDRDAATCQSCHGNVHAIKAVSDSASPVYPLNLPKTCGQCHGNPQMARKHKIPVENPFAMYEDSIHGRAVEKSGLLVAANCSSCHGTHDIRAKDDPDSKVNRRNVPGTCGACHAGVLAQYRTSIHGRSEQAGNAGAPVCIDCHTAHEIERVDTDAWKLLIVKECGGCHKQSLRTYRDTFHGQVTALGFTVVARCSDCHGSHAIVAASDPKSPIAPANRVKTCQKCHQQATASFAAFDPHADRADRKRNPGLYYTALAMNVLIFGVFLFFGIHTGLWLIRSLLERHGDGRGQQAGSR